MGGLVGYSSSNINNIDFGTEKISNSLEEKMWNVEVIIKGTVIDQGPTYKRDAGLEYDNFDYDVTPSTIKIEKVLFGEVPNEEIVLLQHGSLENSSCAENFVKKGSKVILLLTKTTDDKYWSYQFADGIWEINNGKVFSKTDTKQLIGLINMNENAFENLISNAAKNKKKDPSYY